MRKGAQYGAMAGVLAWLFGGIIVGFYLGGYGAISILSKIAGGPVDANLFSRIFVVAGIAVGIVCAGTTAVVVGGLLGAAMGTMAERAIKLVHRTV